MKVWIYSPPSCSSFSRRSHPSEILPLEDTSEFGVCIVGNTGEDTSFEPRKQLGHLSPGKRVPHNVTKTHRFHGCDKTDKCLDFARNFKRREPRSFFEAFRALDCVQFGYLLRKQPFHHGWYRKLVRGCPRLYIIKSCRYLYMAFRLFL